MQQSIFQQKERKLIEFTLAIQLAQASFTTEKIQKELQNLSNASTQAETRERRLTTATKTGGLKVLCNLIFIFIWLFKDLATVAIHKLEQVTHRLVLTVFVLTFSTLHLSIISSQEIWINVVHVE